MTALPRLGVPSHRERRMVPGVKLTVHYITAIRSESPVTIMKEVLAGRIGILVSVIQSGCRPPLVRIPATARFQVCDKISHFETEVFAHRPGHKIDYLAVPDEIHSTDRRHAFRLQAALRPQGLFRLVVDPKRSDEEAAGSEGSVVDLSEGGLCPSTRPHVGAGERLNIELALPAGGTPLTHLCGTTSTEPAAGSINRWFHRRSRGIACSGVYAAMAAGPTCAWLTHRLGNALDVNAMLAGFVFAPFGGLGCGVEAAVITAPRYFREIPPPDDRRQALHPDPLTESNEDEVNQ